MPPPAPERHTDGTLTRAGMETILKSGGSILLKGEVIDSLSRLPSEAELAAGDADRLQAVLAAQEAEVAAQQRDLEATHARLAEAKAKAKEAPKEMPKEAPKHGGSPPPLTIEEPPPPHKGSKR